MPGAAQPAIPASPFPFPVGQFPAPAPIDPEEAKRIRAHRAKVAAERARKNAEAVRALRKKRRDRMLLRLGLGVVLPTVLAAVYYLVIVTPQYESISRFTIQSIDSSGPPAGLSGLLGMLPGVHSSGGFQGVLAREYILSRDMLQSLESKEEFSKHFEASNVDWFSRLPKDATSEERYEYFLDHVTAEFDMESGSVSLIVRAFTAEDARRFAEAILGQTEDQVNIVSNKAREDSIHFAEAGLREAEERLAAARRAILELQQEGADFNPQETAGAVMGVRNTLEGELARARTELSALSAMMQPDAPRVIAQRTKVSALARQVAAQNRRLLGSEEDGVNSSIARFEPLMIEKEFAQHAYQTELASLAMARADAERQHRYVVRISEPSLPDVATYPSPTRGIFTVLLLSFVLLGVGTLVYATLREHANV